MNRHSTYNHWQHTAPYFIPDQLIRREDGTPESHHCPLCPSYMFGMSPVLSNHQEPRQGQPYLQPFLLDWLRSPPPPPAVATVAGSPFGYVQVQLNAQVVTPPVREISEWSPFPPVPVEPVRPRPRNAIFNRRRSLARVNQKKIEDVSIRYRYQMIRRKGKTQLETCAICISDFQTDEDVRRLQCMHLYHVSCVDPWLMKEPHCPTCRIKITVERNF